MRSLEQIHLDELKSLEGLAMNLEIGYARRLAQVAANKYGRMFIVLEDSRGRETTTARFMVSTKDRIQHVLVECFHLDRTVDTQGLRLGFGHIPSDSAVLWTPENDIPEGNRPKLRIAASEIYVEDEPPAEPPVFEVGDRINYLAGSGMWDGSVVTGFVKGQPYEGQLEVTNRDGIPGIIAQGMAELAPPVKIGEVQVSGEESQDIMQAAGGGVPYCVPSALRTATEDRRSAPRDRGDRRSVLVGTYEIVVEGAVTVRYKRLNYTSVPADMVRTDELVNQLTDALNTVAFMEHGLDPAGVLSILNADKWEEENEEVLV